MKEGRTKADGVESTKKRQRRGRSKYIDADTVAPGNLLRKIGHIDQNGLLPGDERAGIRPSSARTGNV